MISPELEDYFLQMNFILQTSPQPRFGIEREMLCGDINRYVLDNLPPLEVRPQVMRRRLYINEELTLMLSTTDAYLDWLYGHGLHACSG